MSEIIKERLPKSIWQLSSYKSKRLHQVLSLMERNELVLGILLGGSISYKNDITKSDIDLFCLIDHIKDFEYNIKRLLSELDDIDEIIYQGSFPWTEKLYTIYFVKDIDFSIDLCLINVDNSETFFWEPDGYILFDKLEIIETCRSTQMSSPNYTRQPFLKANPFSLAVVTLKKIDKNITRNHLWNAIELLNILRRYVIQIIRLDLVKHFYFLGRVDRDIEDVIPPDVNLMLSNTIAIYNSKDIAEKAVMLTDILLKLKSLIKESKENAYQDWIVKQLNHEKAKLSNHFN